jgi:flagellar hook-associated protein 1
MLGLLGTLELARRSLENSRQGVELTGHNLANVNNPAHSRQRLQVQTSETLPGPAGPQGTGAKITGFEQLRNQLLDRQIVNETSVNGYLEAKQKALEFAEATLGQQIDRQATSLEGATAAQGVGGQSGLAEGLSEFFSALQSLSAAPSSTADRQIVLLKAENLTEKFSSINQRLENLREDLNSAVGHDVDRVNQLVKEIAELSRSITGAELGSFSHANDLRDRRQLKFEQLAQLTTFAGANESNKTFSLSIGGVNLISDNHVVDTLETYPDAQGNFQVRSKETGAAANISGGSIKGTIDARDETVATLSADINLIASTLITQINQLHVGGQALNGDTGRLFFTGANASDIKVNALIRQNASLFQASGNGDPGDNSIVLAMAKLGNTVQTGLQNLTFNESYNQSVANFGQALSNVNTQLLDQRAVERMLLRQRDSIGGVSIDEEMTNLMMYQRAFQASAKMIGTLDELLQNVINMGR